MQECNAGAAETRNKAAFKNDCQKNIRYIAFNKMICPNGIKPAILPPLMQDVQAVYSLLGQKRNIVLTTHQKPDGDAMGAALGLYHFLKQLGEQVTVIVPTNWAGFLDWMPGSDQVINYEDYREAAEQIIYKADLLFCLDFNAMYRTKNMEGILTEISCIKILLDHHEQPQEGAFDYGISDVAKSSASEIVYDFIANSPYSHILNKDIATCLFTGIMTDTGSFRFPVATANVHRVVAALKDTGIDHSTIFENIYDNFSESRLRFIGNALLNRLEVLYECNTALMVIYKRDIIKYQIKTGDTEGLVNYLLTIEGVRLGALLIDRSEERKWSFRSKGNFDVNVFARNHFEGGGHKNAAGGRSTATIEQNVIKFKEVIQQYEQQLQ